MTVPQLLGIVTGAVLGIALVVVVCVEGYRLIRRQCFPEFHAARELQHRKKNHLLYQAKDRRAAEKRDRDLEAGRMPNKVQQPLPPYGATIQQPPRAYAAGGANDGSRTHVSQPNRARAAPVPWYNAAGQQVASSIPHKQSSRRAKDVAHTLAMLEGH